MRQLTIFLLSSFLFINALTGQAVSNDKLIQNDTTPVVQAIWGIHWAPLAAMTYQPRLRLGTQFRKTNYEYQLDIYYGRDFWGGTNIFGKERPYMICGLRPEFRKMIGKKGVLATSRRQSYFALAGLFDWRKQNYVNGGVYAEDGQRWQFDFARQERWRAALLLKAGHVLRSRRGFYCDFYAGFGGGNRTITYQDVAGRRPAERPPTEEWGSSSDEARSGSSIQPYLALGVRIGYEIERYGYKKD